MEEPDGRRAVDPGGPDGPRGCPSPCSLSAFRRVYRHAYLRHWALSWLALAVYILGWPATSGRAGERVALRGAVAAVSLVAAYLQVAWLLLGTRGLARDGEPSRRAAALALGAAVLAGLASVPLVARREDRAEPSGCPVPGGGPRLPVRRLLRPALDAPRARGPRLLAGRARPVGGGPARLLRAELRPPGRAGAAAHAPLRLGRRAHLGHRDRPRRLAPRGRARAAGPGRRAGTAAGAGPGLRLPHLGGGAHACGTSRSSSGPSTRAWATCSRPGTSTSPSTTPPRAC